MPASPEQQRIRRELRRSAKTLAPDALERAYAARDRLYVEGVELGITQVQLAEWSGSTPEAVAKVLRKRRDTTEE